jgi:hypothetical protein
VIEYQVNQASVDNTIEWLGSVRLKIFAGIRESMEESLLDLAGAAVAEMTAAGIKNRTGDLAENIIKSPRVTENQQSIFGRVTAKAEMTLAGRTFFGFLGTALDEGYHVPEFDGNIYEFTEPDAGTLYRRGHIAFDIKPHPFLSQAADAWAPSFIEIVEATVNQVVAEANGEHSR